MSATLEELAEYIRLTLPQPKQIVNLKINQQAEAVTFHWQQREFWVRPSLQVLEARNGRNLYITGSSMLIQSALMKRDKNRKVIQMALEVLLQAEDLIKSKQQIENALALLVSVKGTLRKLAGKSA